MRSLSSAVALILASSFVVSCGVAREQEKKPVGPQSSASKMPWNTPQSGQGGGQFGMIPQMNQRR